MIKYHLQGTGYPLLLPVCNEDISVSCTAIVAIAAENDFLTVRREHREGIKAFIPAHFLQPGAVFVDDV